MIFQILLEKIEVNPRVKKRLRSASVSVSVFCMGAHLGIEQCKYLHRVRMLTKGQPLHVLTGAETDADVETDSHLSITDFSTVQDVTFASRILVLDPSAWSVRTWSSTMILAGTVPSGTRQAPGDPRETPTITVNQPPPRRAASDPWTA